MPPRTAPGPRGGRGAPRGVGAPRGGGAPRGRGGPPHRGGGPAGAAAGGSGMTPAGELCYLRLGDGNIITFVLDKL